MAMQDQVSATSSFRRKILTSAEKVFSKSPLSEGMPVNTISQSETANKSDANRSDSGQTQASRSETVQNIERDRRICGSGDAETRLSGAASATGGGGGSVAFETIEGRGTLGGGASG
jgi:hypothetical protein